MSRRQSIAERARRVDGEVESVSASAEATSDDHKFTSSRPRPDESTAATAEAGHKASGRDADPNGPSSRPSRRRDVAEEAQEEEDRFPWHFHFDDDEPQELQASSPLLARAFRATIG